MSRRTTYDSDGLPSSFGGNNQDHPAREPSGPTRSPGHAPMSHQDTYPPSPSNLTRAIAVSRQSTYEGYPSSISGNQDHPAGEPSGPARSSGQTLVGQQDRYPQFLSSLSRAITVSRQTTYDSENYPSSFGGNHQVHPAREPSAPANTPMRHRDPHSSPLSRTPEHPTERASLPHHDIWSRPIPIPIPTAPPRAPSYTAFGSSRRGEYNIPVLVGRPPSPSTHNRTHYKYGFSVANHNPFLHPRGVESPGSRTPTGGSTPECGMTPAHSMPPSPERETMFPIEVSGEVYGGNSVRRRRGGDDDGEKKE